MTSLLTLGKHSLTAFDGNDAEQEPRGILWMWELPRPHATYVVGVDVAVGIEGWARELRSDNDAKTDNSTIEVFRVGAGTRDDPDVQVAEYAAPITPYALAPIINLTGRLYAGSAEDGQALCIIEVYPGPGEPCQSALIHKYGYNNMYVWKMAGMAVVQRTRKLGWWSSRYANRELFMHSVHQFSTGGAVVNSPALVEEMARAESDMMLSFVRGTYGFHDDRLRAAFMACYAAHEWGGIVEPSAERGKLHSDEPDGQRSDMTYEDMERAWADRFAELQGDS